ncbi:MAG: ATP-binding cassette domain-containing protein [Aminipila sp.]
MNLIHSDNQLKFSNIISYPEISITENSFTFISGASGCGKSTYLKMLNRTALPSQGTILYNGKDISKLAVLQHRKEVLLAPQDVFLIDGSIEDNFRFYYMAREEKMLSSEQMKRYLEICCTNFTHADDCTTLSGGERQRVFLAIFLSLASKVLLLDEPTAALDENTSSALLSSIKEYCKLEHITVICVCHNESLIEKFSDVTIRLGAK